MEPPQEQQKQTRNIPAGYGGPVYPLVLDCWQLLSDQSRCAARYLYDAFKVGEVFTIQHRKFWHRLPAKGESASRAAFKRLIDAGLVHRFGTSKGRFGGAVFMLRDALEAYHKNGLQLAADDQQLLLPFAIEDAVEEDLGHGMIRLFDPNATAIDRAFNAQNSAHSDDVQCAEFCALGSSGGAADEGKVGLIQHGTWPGMEEQQVAATSGVESIDAPAEAGTGDASTGFPAPSGTLDATRAPALRAPVGCNSLRQEISNPSIPTNYNQSTNSPFEAPVHPPSARASDDDSIPTDDVDAMVDELQALDEAKVTRIARRIIHAVTKRENELKIPSANRMRPSAAFRWGRVVVDLTVDVSEGHVTELVYDLESLDDLRNPGGLVMSRLKELYRRATGKTLPRRASK